MSNPVSGPLPIGEFKKLVDAPFGEAAKAIRKHDPLWGLWEGQKVRWEVCATAQMTGRAFVEAATREEAEALADELTDAAFDWEPVWTHDIDIDSVEPVKPK